MATMRQLLQLPTGGTSAFGGLRVTVSFLEIVFVGRCEVFVSFCRTVRGVCLSLILLNVFFFFFPLAAKHIGLRTGCQFFKNFRFFRHRPP